MKNSSTLTKLFRLACFALLAVGIFGLASAPLARPAQAQAGKPKPVSELNLLKQQAAAIKRAAGGYKKMSAAQRAEYDSLMARIRSISPVRPRVGRNLPTTFNGTLAGTEPTFNRPDSGSIAGSCSLFGNIVNYTTFQFTPDCVNQGVAISFESSEGGSFSPSGEDTFLCLYGPGGFNPADPCANLVATDDDGGTGFLSRIVTPQLDPGTYTIVVTSFGSGNNFPWTFTLGVVCDSGLLPNINSSMSWGVTGATAGLTPTCAGYADDVTVTGILTNTSQTNFVNISYQVIQLQIPGDNGVFRLVTAADFSNCTGGRVASQQLGTEALPAGQSTTPTFRITRPVASRFLFFFSVIGDVIVPERVGMRTRRTIGEPIGVEVTTGKDGKLTARTLSGQETKGLMASVQK